LISGDFLLTVTAGVFQVTQIKDISDFKQGLALFPLPKPFISIAPDVTLAGSDSKSKL